MSGRSFRLVCETCHKEIVIRADQIDHLRETLFDDHWGVWSTFTVLPAATHCCDGTSPSKVIVTPYEESSEPKPLPPMIVAEVSKSWSGDDSADCLAERFELVIETNAKRGYRLHDWRFSTSSDGYRLYETIVAIFVPLDI